jgi:hypothetical protein
MRDNGDMVKRHEGWKTKKENIVCIIMGSVRLVSFGVHVLLHLLRLYNTPIHAADALAFPMSSISRISYITRVLRRSRACHEALPASILTRLSHIIFCSGLGMRI